MRKPVLIRLHFYYEGLITNKWKRAILNEKWFPHSDKQI